MKYIFGRLDVDNVGDKLELLLLSGDTDGARRLHLQIQTAMRWLRCVLVEEVGCDLLYMGCDDILFRVGADQYRSARFEALRDEFRVRTGCTLSCGFAYDVAGALHNLRVAKLEGRNRSVGARVGGEQVINEAAVHRGNLLSPIPSIALGTGGVQPVG